MDRIVPRIFKPKLFKVRYIGGPIITVTTFIFLLARYLVAEGSIRIDSVVH